MGKERQDVDAQIKSYEPLMHKILLDFGIKHDYEDLLQEMRIVVWKAVTDKNPKTMYIDNGTTKFTTFLYSLMKNRLIDILKVTYKIRLEKDSEASEVKEKLTETDSAIQAKCECKGKCYCIKKPKELSLQVKTKRNLAKPKLLGDLTYKQQMNALQNLYDADSIRLKVDIATFYNTLNDLDKNLWTLNIEGWTQQEMVEILSELGINRTRTTLSKRLKIINDNFVKFIQEGEL